MILIIAFGLILIASYGLYLVSTKQIQKTLRSKWAILAKQPKTIRYIAFIFILIALCCLSHYFGNSIAIVALCLFSTPIIFGLILSINDLKPKVKS
ncbi:MAG: hypothetical protein RR575_07810 [Acinetobacter sp.]